MAESGELHQKIDSIFRKVESIDNFMPWLIKPNAPEIREGLLRTLRKKKSAAKVFLIMDGKKKVKEIASLLGMKSNNVSREATWLSINHLVEQVIDGNNAIYKRSKIDRVLGLSKALRSEVDLSSIQENTSEEESQFSEEETHEGEEDVESIGDNTPIQDTPTEQI